MAAVKEVNQKARLVGINHVALEVGSIEEALSFYGQLFELSLRGRSDQESLHRAWRSVCQDGSSHVANVVETLLALDTDRRSFCRGDVFAGERSDAVDLKSYPPYAH